MEKFYGFAALVLLVACSSVVSDVDSAIGSVVSFDTNPPVSFFVDVANSPESRMRGLMNVSLLPADKGMLFVFGYSQELNFWMKDTLIPLDMVFIEDNVVVDVLTALPCTSEPCAIYSSRGDSVLEINAGLAKKFGISAGTVVSVK